MDSTSRYMHTTVAHPRPSTGVLAGPYGPILGFCHAGARMSPIRSLEFPEVPHAPPSAASC
jgi:hypothetical protein